MSGDPLAAKRPVTPWLAGPYGHPFHPILVTVPIGAWVASLVFDVAGYLVRRPEGLVEGSRWLVALGILGAVLAAAVGLLDLLVIPPGTAAFRVALTHLTLNVLVTAAFAVSLAVRLAQAGRPARSARAWSPSPCWPWPGWPSPAGWAAG